ncbi:MAG: alcohol dehydrogenase catalytic domain-containing protein, partial [Polyangiaceae bacterium]
MKAIVRDAYGGPEVLKFEDVPEPLLGPEEVRVRVRASSLCRADKYVLQGRPFPLRFATGLVTPKKRGLGLDFAGDVVEVGREVDDVRVGDAVYGEAVLGETWAEYACVPARFVARKPRTLGYEAAAIVPDSALTALQGLVREGRLVAGRRVLVN